MSMNILVINCGSSSIKADIIDPVSGERFRKLRVQRVDGLTAIAEWDGIEEELNVTGHEAIMKQLLPQLIDGFEITAVGHRVVHGGDKFSAPVRITDEVIHTIKELSPLAPLHNPANLKGIQIACGMMHDLVHVAVFDTAFHQTLPKRARAYAIPKYIADKHGVRRYGFHGTSHEYVAKAAAEYLHADLRQLRLITCHLGNGCSISAVEYGRSVETSMGMTPLEGLVMGTRSGDVDAGALIQIAREEGWGINELDAMLNNESGLKGLSGVGNDMRDITERASNGDEQAQLAIHVFAHRLRKYIGAYVAVMGGVDAIVFTGGIGENSAVVRHRATQRLDYLGAIVNENLNRELQLSKVDPIVDFSTSYSRVKLLAVSTDEELCIARHAAKLSLGNDKVNAVPVIPIAVSARHVHLTQETLEKLFGAGYQLTEKKPLSQPGQFAANETVTIVGPKNQIERVRILGPVRKGDQVEISRTDEFFLGLDAPVRESGKTENTPGIKIIGPAGEVTINEGVICAWRHIHMTPEDAITFGVKDKDIVEVKVEANSRSLTFGNVLIRVSPKYILEMHIDTDEGNAAELSQGARGVLVSTTGMAHLEKRHTRMDVLQ